MSVLLRLMTDADAAAVLAVYTEGIRGGDATFETETPDWEAFSRGRLPVARHVAEIAGEVVGWVALGPVSSRPCYRGVAEVGVYVAAAAQGRGVGRALLEAAIASAEAAGLWTLTAGIFPENEASLALHERCGFRRVGVRERIGRGQGRWRDVVWLERRSATVGVD